MAERRERFPKPEGRRRPAPPRRLPKAANDNRSPGPRLTPSTVVGLLATAVIAALVAAGRYFL